MSINNKYFNIKSSGVITEVDFEADKFEADLGIPINFTNLSTGEPTTHWSWRFTNIPTGNIETSILENPEMILQNTGKYNVELFAGSQNSGGTKLKEEYLEVLIGINILDNLTDYTASYSLRKTRSLYNGPCIRVRRSNDNELMDIGFVDDYLDIATLTNFVGSATGFVTIWYDQSGFERHAEQSLDSRQPYIIDSGNLIYEGTQVAIRFNQDYFDTPHLGVSGGMLRTTLGVVKNDIASTALGTGNYIALSNISSPTSGGGWTQTLESGGSYTRVGGNAGWAGPNYNSISHSLFELYFQGPNVGDSTLYQNNLQLDIVANTGHPINTQNAGGLIGKYQQQAVYFSGTMQEIIVFNDNKIGNRVFINDSISTFYSL